MTGSSEVDVVVLGLGPGGEAAAGRLADEGLAVVGVDDTLVGGECPYWGCVPSKMMLRGADLLMEGRRINGMSGSAVVDPDWSPVAARLREATGPRSHGSRRAGSSSFGAADGWPVRAGWRWGIGSSWFAGESS